MVARGLIRWKIVSLIHPYSREWTETSVPYSPLIPLIPLLFPLSLPRNAYQAAPLPGSDRFLLIRTRTGRRSL